MRKNISFENELTTCQDVLSRPYLYIILSMQLGLKRIYIFLPIIQNLSIEKESGNDICGAQYIAMSNETLFCICLFLFLFSIHNICKNLLEQNKKP